MKPVWAQEGVYCYARYGHNLVEVEIIECNAQYRMKVKIWEREDEDFGKTVILLNYEKIAKRKATLIKRAKAKIKRLEKRKADCISGYDSAIRYQQLFLDTNKDT